MLNDEDIINCIDKEDNSTPIVIEIKDSKSLPLWKDIVLFVVGCIGIYVVSIIAVLITRLLNLGSESEFDGASNFITYAMLFVALLGVLNIHIPRFSKDKKWPSILVGVGIGVGMIAMPIFYNIFVSFFRTTDISDNEKGLRSFITIYPMLSVIFLGFIGPICEELTYRVGLFNIFKKHKWLAYFVSILIFAFMHFGFTSEDIVNEFINLPVYIFSGAMLALAYDKFGFWGSLSAHITNNVYSVCMIILYAQLGLLNG